MRRVALITALSLFSLSVAADEAALSGNQIQTWLAGRTAISTGPDGWRQYFNADGNTPYLPEGGEVSDGKWAVRDNQYCSLWPPAETWDCYAMTGAESADGKRTVTWIDSGGGRSPADLVVGDRLRVE